MVKMPVAEDSQAAQTLRRAIAWLCDPAPVSTEPQVARAELPALLDALRHNKVPLLTVQVWHPEAALWRTPQAIEALSRERQALSEQRAEFARVIEAFTSAGIHSALVKSVGLAPPFPYRSDNVDTLVPQEQGADAARALLELGYVELRNIEEPHKFLFKRFAGGGVASAIHLHEQVGWGTGFLDERWLWERVSPSFMDRLVVHPSPEDGLLITVAHAFYEDKEVKAWDLVKARHCVSQSGFDWDYVARQAEARGWLRSLGAALRFCARVERGLFGASFIPEGIPGHPARDFGWESRYASRLAAGAQSLPAPIPFGYSKRHYFAKLAADRTLSAGHKLDDALRHTAAGLKRQLGVHSQRPMLVALSGVDGSGKTAHAESLQASFAACDIRARVVWSRGGSSPLTDALIRLGKRLTGRRAADETDSSTDPRLAGRAALWARPAVRLFWPWALALDLWRQYLPRVAWPLMRGWVVIADRYTADAVAEVEAYLAAAGHPGSPVALRLLGILSPRPICAYLLRVPPELAAERKGGAESGVFLAAQAEAYDQLVARGRLVPLENSQDFDSVSSTLVRRVLTRYYRSYRTLLNALFLSNPRVRRPGPDEAC